MAFEICGCHFEVYASSLQEWHWAVWHQLGVIRFLLTSLHITYAMTDVNKPDRTVTHFIVTQLASKHLASEGSDVWITTAGLLG